MFSSSQVFTGEDVQSIGIETIFNRSIQQLQRYLNHPGVGSKRLDSQAYQYDFSHPVRGFGIVICNENFRHVPKRNSANLEMEHMSDMFSVLNFLVIKFKDLTTRQMVNVLSEAASRTQVNDNADAFAFALGSHGEEEETAKASDKPQATQSTTHKVYHHVVYGTDGTIATSELLSLFDDQNCQSLRGKPKMFFIQACRNRGDNQLDKGARAFVSKEAQSSHSTADDNDSDSKMIASLSVHVEKQKSSVYVPYCPNNFLIMMATSEGIYDLCSMLSEQLPLAL